MLLLGSRLIGTPIMSLQTGTRLAETKAPLIDPANLKIMAYEVEGPMLDEHPSFLRIADVRELSTIGMIIDSSDEFIGVEDVISIHKLYDLSFTLIGKAVIDETKHKLGKIEEYSFDTDSFIIQKLHVKRGVFKSLTETTLLVDRSQIIEINDRQVIVRTTAKKLETVTRPAATLSYSNPFRQNSPQVENTTSSEH